MFLVRAAHSLKLELGRAGVVHVARKALRLHPVDQRLGDGLRTLQRRQVTALENGDDPPAGDPWAISRANSGGVPLSCSPTSIKVGHRIADSVGRASGCWRR